VGFRHWECLQPRPSNVRFSRNPQAPVHCSRSSQVEAGIGSPHHGRTQYSGRNDADEQLELGRKKTDPVIRIASRFSMYFDNPIYLKWIGGPPILSRYWGRHNSCISAGMKLSI
jgi:hypothetical protein